MDHGTLRRQLERSFSLDELHTLCFDLGINEDNVPGSTLESKTRELVKLCERLGRLADLIQLCAERRPTLTWLSFPTSNNHPASLRAAIQSPSTSPPPPSTSTRHRWTTEEDLVALYLARWGDEYLELSIQEIAERLGLKVRSLEARIQNFRGLAGQSGLSHAAHQSRQVYQTYQHLDEAQVRHLVLATLQSAS